MLGTNATDEFKNGMHKHSKNAWNKLNDLTITRVQQSQKGSVMDLGLQMSESVEVIQ